MSSAQAWNLHVDMEAVREHEELIKAWLLLRARLQQSTRVTETPKARMSGNFYINGPVQIQQERAARVKAMAKDARLRKKRAEATKTNFISTNHGILHPGSGEKARKGCQAQTRAAQAAQALWVAGGQDRVFLHPLNLIDDLTGPGEVSGQQRKGSRPQAARAGRRKGGSKEMERVA